MIGFDAVLFLKNQYDLDFAPRLKKSYDAYSCGQIELKILLVFIFPIAVQE
jgi:hypothetical protein